MDMEIALHQQARILPADTQTPVSLYLDLIRDAPGILLESAEVDGHMGRYSLLAWDFSLLLTCREGNLHCTPLHPDCEPLARFNGQPLLSGLRGVMRALRILPPEGGPNLPPMTRSLLGSFGYGLAGVFEPRLRHVLPPENAHLQLVLPAQQILFDHLHSRCIYLGLNQDEPTSFASSREHSAQVHTGPVQSTPDQNAYRRAVERTREMIHAGEAIQVVLSTRFQTRFSGSPFSVYRRLRQVNPSPYMFFLQLPEMTVLGSSPELLVRCTNGYLEEHPIAGTRKRGRTAQEDEALARELSTDQKERAEHVMLVDLARNDLGRIAAPGSVEVSSFLQVERFSHVMHLTSSVSARLAPELDALDVLRAAFPAGTVSGAPKIRAMEIIAQEEELPRGPYAGAVGWLGLDPGRVDLDTGITIRSLWLQDGQLMWQAGAGIVSDSDPQAEWEECQSKASVVTHILNQNGGSDVFAHR